MSTKNAKQILEMIATLAAIAVSASVIWAIFARGGTARSTTKSPRTGQAAERAQVPVPTEAVSVAGLPIIGLTSAPITVIEFSDFECPFCGTFVRNTLPQFKKDFIDTGRARLVFWQYPLEIIHKQALSAAAAAECAAQQGKFWPMHDRLFADRRKLDPANLRLSAEAEGLDLDGYDRCRLGGTPKVVADAIAQGNRFAITGTPTFFVGTTLLDGRVQVAERFSGASSIDRFKASIDGIAKQP